MGETATIIDGGSHIDVEASVPVGKITDGGFVCVGTSVMVPAEGVTGDPEVTEGIKVAEGAVVGEISVPFVGNAVEVGPTVVGGVPEGIPPDVVTSVPFEPGSDVGVLVGISTEAVVLLPGREVSVAVGVGIEIVPLSVGILTDGVG